MAAGSDLAEYAPTVERVPGETFLVLAYDREDGAESREQELDGHLTYIEKHVDRYLACGPLREPGGSQLIGSFFLVLADDEAAARDFLNGDPYMRCGMYKEVRVLSATPAAGQWMGGVIWESAKELQGRAS